MHKTLYLMCRNCECWLLWALSSFNFMCRPSWDVDSIQWNMQISPWEPTVLKTWRNWPTLLAKHHCSRPNSNVRWLSIANATETNNSVWQAMLASFARPLRHPIKFTIVDPSTAKLTIKATGRIFAGARSKHSFELQNDKKKYFLLTKKYFYLVTFGAFTANDYLMSINHCLDNCSDSVHATLPKTFRKDSASCKVQKDHNLGYIPDYICHYMFTIRSLYVYHRFTVWSLYIDDALLK